MEYESIEIEKEKEKSNKPTCFNCREVVRYCDKCYKDLDIGDKIICDDFNDYGRHYCSKKCYREAYDKDYTLIVGIVYEVEL